MQLPPPIQIDPKALETLVVAARHGLGAISPNAASNVLAAVSQSIMIAEQILTKRKEQDNAQAGGVEAPVPGGN